MSKDTDGTKKMLADLETKVNGSIDKDLKSIHDTTQKTSELTNELCDLFINTIEERENVRNNVLKIISLADLEEARDVTIILEIMRKYCPDNTRTEQLDMFIRGMNYATKEQGILGTSYDITAIKNLDKNAAQLLFAIICTCNQLSGEYDQEIFGQIRDEVAIGGSIKKVIENTIPNCVRNSRVEDLIHMFIGDQHCPEEEKEEEIITQQSVEESGDYNKLRELIRTQLLNKDNSFDYNADSANDKNTNKNKKKIAAFVNKHGLVVTDNTLIGLIEYEKLGELTRKNILFTTHAIYVTNEKKLYKVAYKELLHGISNIKYDPKNKSVVFILSDKEKLYLDNKKFDNESLFNVFSKIMNEFNDSMVADKDTVTPVANMKESLKLNYLKIVMGISPDNKILAAEVYRLANDLKCHNDTLRKIIDYSHQRNEPLENLITNIKTEVPYPSLKSLGYALFRDCYRLLYLSKDCAHDSFVLLPAEKCYLDQISSSASFNIDAAKDENIRAALLIPQMALGLITEKEFNMAAQALITATASIGVPLGVVTGANTLFASTLWFWFIPGIGTILAVSALAGITTALIGKKNLDKKKSFLNQRTDIVEKELDSYSSIYTRAYIIKINTLVDEIPYYTNMAIAMKNQKELILKEQDSTSSLKDSAENIASNAKDAASKISSKVERLFRKK